MPSLTYHFGLRPWDLERMTLREIAEYRTQLIEMQQNNQPAERSDSWD